jgi:peptide/nickel transport system substrate-binding protein
MNLRALLLAASLALTGLPQAQAETFTWSFQGDIQGMDPYALNETFTIGFLGNIYEGLVRRDRDLNLEPSLATEWSNPEPNVWRFKLREDVKFHNGEDFTADDVVFSFERVTKPGSDLAPLLFALPSFPPLDDHTIEFVTHAPDPILPQTLSLWYIIPRA